MSLFSDQSPADDRVLSSGEHELRATKILLAKTVVASWASDAAEAGRSQDAKSRRGAADALQARVVSCGDTPTLSGWAASLLDFVEGAGNDLAAEAAAWVAYDATVAALAEAEDGD